MKFLKKKDPFLSAILHGLLGAVIGLFSGLVLGILIFWIGNAMSFLDEEVVGLYNAAPFFAMGCGSILGSLMGGLAGLKK